MISEAHGKRPHGKESVGGAVRAARRSGDTGHSGDGERASRSCAACRSESNPRAMIRWVRSPSGEVAPDLGRKSFGRGAWLHADARCLGKLTSALSRSFRAPVTTSPEQGLLLIRAAAEKKVRDLLGAARRQRRLELGSAAVEEALQGGIARLVVVACDARAAAETSGVRRAIAAGKACAWGSKEGLGRICGRSEVGVIAVTEDRLATALFDAIALAHSPGTPVFGPSAERADVLTEVE